MKTIEKFEQEYQEVVRELFCKEVNGATKHELFVALAASVKKYAAENWEATEETLGRNNQRQVYYFSMEFLMGRLLTNNLMNLGIYHDVEKALKKLNINLNELEEVESDAGLGNGGLGRLAACFLDSIASLQYPGHGNTIRYQYGFFNQKIENGYQIETPDQWLADGPYVWETPRPEHAKKVKFWGRIEPYADATGNIKYRHLDAQVVRAMPYDVPIIGFDTKTVNTLRMWKAEVNEDYPIANSDFEQYEKETRAISNFLYPDDTTWDGKILRLKQQYFFSSSGIQWVIDRHLKENESLDNFHEKVCIQINDTHPTLVIPELMRLLMDEYNYSWEDAWKIVTQSVAYTNHTLLSEALEKWPVGMIQPLLPRVYQIIEEINRRYCGWLIARGCQEDEVRKLAIIADGNVHMAHLAVHGTYSVNGVAALHTELLITQEMKQFNELYPGRFNNKTNGITHRRWLAYANPKLANLITENIGDDWMKDPQHQFTKLSALNKKQAFLQAFSDVKRERKQILADYIQKETGYIVNVNSIFDIQIKRLHAYKRQMLNVLHIMYLYNELKANPDFTIQPQTFIFAAKAAPGYYFAKKVIKLINELMHKINNDPAVNQKLQVIFLPNYNVRLAEILFPAADISEQISTAGKEASGTGNMKFMMNGALTIGTMDGANVEIHELVGDENIAIFGMLTDEVNELRNSHSYHAKKWMERDARLTKAIHQIHNPQFFFGSHIAQDEFDVIVHDLIDNNDEYFLLADFDSYVKAQAKLNRLYPTQQWGTMCINNIAQSGFFTSDRTIQNYVDDIWKIKKIRFEK
ncbi:MAG: glycogen/starch/alpha-glucan phosphorylase [Culicoidibacterales bacterium]